MNYGKRTNSWCRLTGEGEKENEQYLWQFRFETLTEKNNKETRIDKATSTIVRFNFFYFFLVYFSLRVCDGGEKERALQSICHPNRPTLFPRVFICLHVKSNDDGSRKEAATAAAAIPIR